MVTTFGWRTRARSRPSLMIDGARAASVSGFAGSELERDLAIQARVPGTIHDAACTVANRLEEAEVAPGRRQL